MAAVVVLTPSLTYVVLGALAQGHTLWAQASGLPGYLRATFLHLDFGTTGPRRSPSRSATTCSRVSRSTPACSPAAW
ncbi:MAG: hypothetical protein ACXVSX_10660 [Solirubrobacteraceae bacterium]